MEKQDELANKILCALVAAWADQNHVKVDFKVVKNEESNCNNILHVASA